MHIIERGEDGAFVSYPEATFVCVFDRWLSPEETHLLDEVKPSEWRKFEALSERLLERFELMRIDPLSGACHVVQSEGDLQDIRTTCHADELGRGGFGALFIPELDCVYQEEFDYTNALWHRAGAAPRRFLDLVEEVGLHHFDREEGFARRAQP